MTDEQKRDLVIVCILTSEDSSCKAMVRQARCPRKAWRTLCKTFESVSEVSIDAKLSQQQLVELKKGEYILEFFHWIVELVSELEDAGKGFRR